jgi:hypothetical protein
MASEGPFLSGNIDPPTSFPAVHRTEVDGVPTYWVEDEGPCRAGLVFRSGESDEPPTHRGLSNLVQRLAIGTLGDRPYEYAGGVDGSTTTFAVVGNPDEVAEHIRLICAALVDLPLSRLRAEGRALRLAGSVPGSDVPLERLRFGLTSIGRIGFRELALCEARPNQVRSWAESRFTRGNCVLWVAGRLPENMAIRLADGPRFPLPEPAAARGLVLPGFVRGQDGGVKLSVVSQRTSATATVIRVANSRLAGRLRHELRPRYRPEYEREPLPRGWAHHLWTLTCDKEMASAAQRELLQLMEDLASNGPTVEELQTNLRMMTDQTADPKARIGAAVSAAHYDLVGMPTVAPAELVEEQRAVSPGHCAQAMTTMMTTAIVMSPLGSERPPASYAAIRIDQDPLPSGRVFRPYHADGKTPAQPEESLIVSAEGMSLVKPKGSGRTLTIIWPECEALHLEGDHNWKFYGRQGWSIAFKPGVWQGVDDLVEAIEALVPPDRLVAPPQ